MSATVTDQQAAGDANDRATASRDVQVTRWVATIAGLIGFVLSVATPLLPVVQTTAMLNWPQNGQLNSVTAPLISLTPVDMLATVPCSVVRNLPPGGGVILGTGPKKGKDAALNALFVVASDKRVDVTDRNVVIASVTREQAMSAQCQHIEITSTHAGTFATFVGLNDPSGRPVRGGFPDPNLRPQVVGVFTDLTGPAPPALQLSATIDTRFSTTPTTLKLFAMVAAIVATIVALVALWRLDQLDGRRMRRLIPANWRTFTLADVTVIFGFVLWHVIGANSSDDGYILGMARVADHAGYMSNYFRWFGSPEDPFGWYYNLLALMTHVSDNSLWMRLPDLIAGVVCWLLLSREVLPRLGPAVAASKPANWAAGMVLLTAWMPFDNGLRPEPIIALGSLVTYVLIERSMRYSRLTPAALAVVTAAFTLGVQPTGLIAVAALIAGGRPILRILVRRHRVVGTMPLVAPMLAAGSVILTVVFADQTLSTVLEATRIRTAVGPSQAWYTENLRYYYLILPTVDGSLSRRFGFFITALCLFTAVFIMLRRKRVPGVARGPAWRLMGVIFGTMFFLMFTPTKWVHHFGLFAAVGAAMAALTTVLVSPAILRWSRNRMAFLAALMFLLALCFATTNGWWYVSSYGVPFNSTMPKIAGMTVSTIFFILFAITALYAVYLHFASRDHGEGRLARALTAAPVPVAAGFMALVFVASMVAGIVRQYPTYSNGWANVRALAGGCGLADDVLVEPDSNAGFMVPLPGNSGSWGPLGPLGGANPVGFSPNGVPEHTVAEAVRITPNQPGTDYDWDAPTKLDAPGINGSLVPLPYGLNPDRVPVAGSYTTGCTTAEQAHVGVVPAAQTGRRAPAGGGDRRRQDRRQQRAARIHHRPDRRAGVRQARPRRRPGAGRAAGARRSERRTAQGVAQPALRPIQDARGCGCGPGGGRRPVPDAGRLDRGDPAAGTGAALPAGVRRLDAAGATGLGGRIGLPVPAADAARRRRDRDPQVPHHAGLHGQEDGHRHLGGRRQRRPAGHHRPAAAGPCHVHLPVA